MPALTCSFCKHANPAGAKFCNECGSGLDLRPCARCEAINDVDATYCHQCGALLDARAAPSPSASQSPVPATGAQRESLVIGAASAVAPEFAATRPPSPPSVKELASAAERLDAFWRDSMQAVDAARAMKPDAPAPERSVDSLPIPADAESTVINVGARYREDRRAGLWGPLAIAVLLVGAAGAYYAYEHWAPGSVPPTTSAPIVLTAPAHSTARAPEAAAAAAPATPTIAASVPAPSATGASAARASSTASEASVSAEPPSASPAEVIGGAARAPDASQPVIARPQANPSSPPTPEGPAATDAPAAQRLPSPAPGRAGTEADGAKRVAAPVRRPRPVTSPSIASPAPARLPATLPGPEVPAVASPAPGGACSDSVAALGLCNR